MESEPVLAIWVEICEYWAVDRALPSPLDITDYIGISSYPHNILPYFGYIL